MLLGSRPLSSAPATTARFRLAPYLGLLKLRIVALLVFVSLVAAVLAGQGTLALDRLLLLALAGALSSAGAGALNQYFERDIDAEMSRTRLRPLPAGKLRPRVARVLGLVLIALALPPAFALGPGSATFVLLGAFFYVIVYTFWLKRSSALNVPIGGLAGSCAVLTGWLAVRNDLLAPAPLLLAGIIYFWNKSHFWALAIARGDEYRKAGVPMLPVLVGARPTSWAILANTLALVLASLAVFWALPLQDSYLGAAVGLGSLFVWLNLRLAFAPNTRIAWVNFKFSGVYLLALFLAMGVTSLR